MALADILRGGARGIASATPGGRQALRINQLERAEEQEVVDTRVERLRELREMVPDNSREAMALDAKLVELAPDLATQGQTRDVRTDEGFIQHEPAGVRSAVTQDPEVASAQRESQRSEARRRSAAGQINRMQRLPEELRRGMAEQALLSDDPEAVLKTAREYGRNNVKSAQGAFSESLREREGNGNFVAVRTPDGVKRQTTDDQGNIRLVAPPKDFQMVDTSVTGSPDEVLPSGEGTDLRDQQVATMNFVDTTRDTLNLLQENPDINTWTASGAALLNDLQQEGKALARASGIEFDENILDPARYQDTFDNLGIQSERMKSLFVSLAFQAGIASGQTGRSVSDKDIARFMQQVGQRSSDPRALAQTLTDLARRTTRSFKNSYKVRRGEDFEGDLGLSTLPTFDETDPEIDALIDKYTRDE